MEHFIDFLFLRDPNIRFVVVGSIILALSSSVVGTFTFLKKRALAGDVVAHAVLPGVCLSFVLSGTKNPFLLILGAFVTGWLSLIFIEFVTQRSKIKEDTALGLTLSVFFGIGIFLLTVIQRTGNASQSGLEHFLFGNATAMVQDDLLVFGVVGIILILTITLFYKEFKLLSFDPAFSKVIGLKVKSLELLLTSLTVLAIVIGIQAVGVVLMSSMLIAPAAAAKFWTNKLLAMIFLAGLFSTVSGVIGCFVSYNWPSMPTGPWIVVIISLIAVFSFFFSPTKGIVAKQLQQKKIKDKILTDNILKLLYQLSEHVNDFYSSRTLNAMIEKRAIPEARLLKGLKYLATKGLVEKHKEQWALTKTGKEQGQRIVKLHRLWEVYLTNYLQIAADHVHEDAETIEHIITPEIELQLEKLLKFPAIDPHKTNIPY